MGENKEGRNTFPNIYVIDVLKNYSNKSDPLNVKKLNKIISDTTRISIGPNDKNYVRRQIKAINNHFGKTLLVETKDANKEQAWYYDAKVAETIDILVRPTDFTEEEASLIFDMIASCKLLTESGTLSILDKLATPLGGRWKKRKEDTLEKYKNLQNGNDYAIQIFNDINKAIINKKLVDLKITDNQATDTLTGVFLYKIYEKHGEEFVVFGNGQVLVIHRAFDGRYKK